MLSNEEIESMVVSHGFDEEEADYFRMMAALSDLKVDQFLNSIPDTAVVAVEANGCVFINGGMMASLLTAVIDAGMGMEEALLAMTNMISAGHKYVSLRR